MVTSLHLSLLIGCQQSAPEQPMAAVRIRAAESVGIGPSNLQRHSNLSPCRPACRKILPPPDQRRGTGKLGCQRLFLSSYATTRSYSGCLRPAGAL
jgi:hypothetical protein